MDDANKKAILATINTPGWGLIVDMAQRRIDSAKMAALANGDESKFLELYRACHAAQGALWEFVTDLKALIGE